MKFLLAIFYVLVINAISIGQDYVVTNRGDTLSGSIKNPLFEHQLFSRIVLKNDEKQSFGPSKVRSFVKEGVLFESHNVGDKNSDSVFLKLVIKGPCSLYEYQYVTHNNFNGIPNTSQPQTMYYLKRENEKFHAVRFSALKAGKDFYFIDNGSLTYDMRNGKYRKYELQKIVERYNREFTKNDKILVK